MANSYVSFAGGMNLPAGKLEEAREIVNKKLEEIAEVNGFAFDESLEDINGTTFRFDSDDNVLYYMAEENGNAEMVATVLEEIVDQLQIDEPVSLQWAFTCSKQRVDEFGGGAFVVRRGKPTEWLDTGDWIQKVIG